MAAIREGSDAQAATPPDIAFETAGDEVFRRYARNWKPSTLNVNQGYYRNQILPWFKGHPIAAITVNDVRRWFASLHETPAAADRADPRPQAHVRQPRPAAGRLSFAHHVPYDKGVYQNPAPTSVGTVRHGLQQGRQPCF